jgi:hypothetical protein
MTPERQKWWDSLPAEEKRVRMDIELCKKQIKWQKRNLRWVVLTGDECKMIINHNKRVIKALRKQIAMRPYVLKTTIGNFDKCPCCSVRLIKYFPRCACCGQKLRW